MSASIPPDRRDRGQLRLAAVVIAVAMTAWIGLQWLASHLGWPGHYAFLIDFAAIAAFVWSLVVTWRVWQRRRPA